VAEELGDVLLQVLFHARVADERRAFGIDDVARGIVDKLVHRHPHVFGDGDAATADEVQANWDELKSVEKGRTGVFDGVPEAMPGLALLAKLQHKASAAGLWEAGDASGRVRELLESLPSERDALDEHFGELLAAVVMLARTHDVDAEAAARAAARRFRASIGG
ncbi:MAG: MazG nucleotide pyrophosphohydrolase domain-containing protein, partial [Nitriliruptoraceae bacterium]